MSKKRDLVKFIRIWGAISFISLAGIVVATDFTINYGDYQIHAEEMRVDYINQQKDYVKREVVSMVGMIDYDLRKSNWNAEGYVPSNDVIREIWLDRINHIRFGTNGYMFALDFKGTSLAHGSQPEIIGKNGLIWMDSRGNRTTQLLIDVAKNGGGFVSFWWKKPDTGVESEKMTYAVRVADLDMIIAAGIYIDDVEGEITHIRETLYKHILTKAMIIFLATSFAFGMFHLLFNRFNKLLGKDVDLFVDFFSQASLLNKTINRDHIQFTELDQMAEIANKMVTEKNITNESLTETLHLLEESQRLASMGSWDMGADMVTLKWSDETYKIFEVDLDYTGNLFEKFQEIVHPDDVESVIRHYDQALIDKKPYIYNHRLLFPDGRVKYVIEHCESEYDENGEPVKSLGLVHDITESVIAEDTQHKLESQLQQAQKMEAIGVLAGGIAHDFNNILSVIIGFSELSRQEVPEDSKLHKNLTMVLDAGNRATNLVRQILSFSRQQNTESVPLLPSSVVSSAIDMIRPTLPTTINIIKDIDTETGLVFGDPTKLHQIMINLCTNAFHAMEENGGTLNIKLKEVTLSDDDLITQVDVKAGNFIQISVMDSGIGMTKDTMSKMFDPYFTTKDIGKGTGMGLSIVHGIIKSYDGFITVYSHLGMCTTINVFLPVIERKGVSEIKMANIAPTGTERILFVDDEPMLVDMGEMLFESLGYTVTACGNSDEALAIFKENPQDFDIVITDQTMPNLTGTELSSKILKIRPDIPIILCTGYSSIITEQMVSDMGIREFVIKPMIRGDIAKLIRKVLDSDVVS